MKKFLLVLLIVLIATSVLAACAQVDTIEDGIKDLSQSFTDKAIPTWIIIVGAIILFFVCFGIVWRLIPGFIKFIVLIAIAGAIAGAAYGIWTIPAYDKAKNIVDDVSNVIETVQTDKAD